MNMTVWDIVASTPWWVYLVFIYCIRIGFKARHDGVLDIRLALILPIVFTVMGVDSVIQLPALTAVKVITFIIGILLGAGAGLLIARVQQPSRVKGRPWAVHLKGGWYTFGIIMAIFIVKYTEGVLMAVKSPLLDHVSTVAAFIILSAFCTGMLIGRVIKYLLVLLGRLA